ncbi:cysteine ABC transporter permease [Sphingomonas sp. HMWF008]|nr:cysteine ABC transporter permease [Sphingomonas sp. HMWF008]
MSKAASAGHLWAFDVAGAALFAFGLASSVGHLTDGTAPGAIAYLAIFGGAALRAGSVIAVNRVAIVSAQSASATLRQRLLPHLLGVVLPRPLLAGESAAFAIDHVAAIETSNARFAPVRFHAALGPLLVVAIVGLASWVAALIMLLTLLPFVLGMILAGSAARTASERQLAALSALSGLFVDRLRHLPLIRHFGAEDRVARQVGEATRAVADRTVLVLRAAFLSGAVLEFFAALAVALIAVYCGFSLLGALPFRAPEPLTLTSAFFVLAMAPEFYLPMRRLAAAYHEKQLGAAATSALATIAPDTPAALSPTAPFDGLRVTRLRLDWPGVAIGPIDLALSPHDLVVLTGPTGSGKSSLLAAIAGQCASSGGSVTTVSGHALDPAEIAWAAQRPLLLPGTLAENIALAAPHATRDAIQAAACRVGLDALLRDRPEGLDLVIDHRGSGLSGGERRRIGLARAILSGRPLLLCDEPTADLDSISAAAIRALLLELARERCVLVATHDPDLTAAARLTVAL